MNIRSLLYTIYLWLVFLILFMVFLTLASILSVFQRDRQAHFQDWARHWANTLIFFSGMRANIQGQKNLDQNKNYIIVANHQGLADIPIILAALPIRFYFVIKAELFSIPLFGWYLRLAGFIPVERGSAASAFRSFKRINSLLESGHSVLFFPEGTRSKDGGLGVFKRGSLKAAYDTGVPVLPVALSGSYNLIKRGSLLMNPVKVRVSIGKAIRLPKTDDISRQDQEADLERVRSAVDKLLRGKDV